MWISRELKREKKNHSRQPALPLLRTEIPNKAHQSGIIAIRGGLIQYSVPFAHSLVDNRIAKVSKTWESMKTQQLSKWRRSGRDGENEWKRGPRHFGPSGAQMFHMADAKRRAIAGVSRFFRISCGIWQTRDQAKEDEETDWKSGH